MSFYTKPVKALTFIDVRELLDSQAQEGIRLEFKSDHVGQDEHLKKVCSFANTLGGRIVYGVAQDGASRAVDIPGVVEDTAFETRLTDWCAHYLHEPLVPEVSAAIPVPGSNKVVYVVHVEESDLAPHFIEGRKGCYIRTNERSQRFEALTADPPEIKALLNRREDARKRAQEFKTRSHGRISKRLELLKRVINSPAPFVPITVRVAPSYPKKPLVSLQELEQIAAKANFEYGASPFPYDRSGVYSHADSLIFSQARGHHLTFLELTRYGSVSYTDFIQAEGQGDHVDFGGAQRLTLKSVRMGRVMGATLLGAKYAARFCDAIGMRGSYSMSPEMSDLQYVAFETVGLGRGALAIPFLDENVEVERIGYSETFAPHWKDIAIELWRELYFALGWKDALAAPGEQAAKRNLEDAYSILNLPSGILE